METFREWLLVFVDYLANKQIMAEILNSLAGRSERVRSHSPEILVDTLADLLDWAKMSGDLATEIKKQWIYCAPLRVWRPLARRMVGVERQTFC